MSRCLVSTCGVEIGAGRRLCEQHWRALPGRERARLSMVARTRRSPVTDQQWEAARLHLEGNPA